MKSIRLFLKGHSDAIFGESSIRGYHAYFKDTTVCIGDILFCETESDNNFDKYAVAVKTDNGELVGHVQIELSKIFTDFLKDYGDIEVECIGCRYSLRKRKGMEVPVDYRNLKYLKKLKKKLTRLSHSVSRKALRKVTAIEPSNLLIACHRGFNHNVSNQIAAS